MLGIWVFMYRLECWHVWVYVCMHSEYVYCEGEEVY